MISTLQAGRAIAAVSVAAFHLTINMASPRYGGTEVFDEVTRYGKHGVDFFFVLSGFIILLAHARDIGHPGAWTNYLYRRFVRVYPIYWLYTLGFVAVLLVAGGTDATMPDNALDWLTSLSLIRFTDATPPLGQAWTLFHEVGFYTVFSILILNRMAGLVALGLFAAGSVVFHPDPQDLTRTASNVYLALYNLYFVFGMIAYRLYKRGGKGVAEALVGTVVTIGALAAPWHEKLSPLVLAAGLALMLAGLAKLEKSGFLSVPRWLTFVGNASYSIYLTHINVEGLLLKIMAKLGLAALLGPYLTYFVVLAGTVGVGCVAYVLVERPLLTMLTKRKREEGTPPVLVPGQATHGP